jgi:hypothetical protein
MCRPPSHRREASSHDAVQQIAPSFVGGKDSVSLPISKSSDIFPTAHGTGARWERSRPLS